MSVLSPASKKALANLRAFKAPATNYYKCPLTRRAAVLILLIADRKGDLRVVLTIRSAGLRNYAGQAALPGGKADSLSETPFMTARREAFEEIGLPLSDAALPPGYTVEHLTELPANLAMTELGVRPCVAYLGAAPPPSSRSNNSNSTDSDADAATAPPRDAQRDILPRLDAREVAAVFTAPFRNFLYSRDLDAHARAAVPGEWYRGSWHSWHESAWRMHQFFVPVEPATVFLARTPRAYTSPREPAATAATAATAAVAKERGGTSGGNGAGTGTSTSTSAQKKTTQDSTATLQPPLPKSFYANAADPLLQPRYRVFGMTARILIDCARVAYGHEPDYEHNSDFGDEAMIERLIKIGRLSPVRKQGDVLTRDVMEKAAKAKM